MDKTVATLVRRARQRISTKTMVQDVSEPLTGEIDRRKLTAKFTNIEHAVDDLANAVDVLNEQVS
jgi:hypothetical protein